MTNLLPKITSVSLFFFFISLASIEFVWADWPCKTDSSVPIVTAAGNQWNVQTVSDGMNGAILVWQDRRAGTIDKLYIQRVSSAGVPLWEEGGILLASATGFQYYPQIVSDGFGGAFIVWQDNRFSFDYDIFAQRISESGLVLWTPGGTLVCNATGHQYNPQIVRDGLGGVLITWQDRRSGNFDIYAQRYDPNGQMLWTLNGEIVCNVSSDQIDPKLVPDGRGGAIVAWTDYRSGTGFADIYAQRINANAINLWLTDGVPISTASNTQWNVQVTTDGAEGAIFAWQDRRAGAYDNIYAQMVDNTGEVFWEINGIPIASAAGIQYYPQIASDGSGGAIITWQDNRKGTDYDVYAQRIDRFGNLKWPASGKPVCTADGHQYNPRMVVQNPSILITWQDKRGSDFDIYAQRLNFNGEAQWDTNGVAVFSSSQDQIIPQVCSDSVYGAIVTWSDYQSGAGTTDIFSHRIGANSKPAGGCYTTFLQDSFALKAIRIRKNKPPPTIPNEGNIRDTIFARGYFPKGITLGIARLDSPKSYGWIYYAKSSYVRKAFPQYSAARPFDLIGDKPFVGKKRNPSNRRYNNRLCGELLALKLNIAASDLGITESNFGELVFKDTTIYSAPIKNKTLRQITSVIDSMLTYWNRYQGINYLRIALMLRKINGAFASQLDTLSLRPLRVKQFGPLFSTDFLVPSYEPPPLLPRFVAMNVEEELPLEAALYQNYPNPFNPLTTIEFELIEPSKVTLIVYDILGREVQVLFDHAELDDGYQSTEFDASNLSSGIYFYRLLAEPVSSPGKIYSQMKKMMLIK